MSEKVDLIINVKVAGLDTVVQMATAAARQITQAFLTIHAAMEQGANLTKDTLLGVIAQVSAASAEMSNKYKGMSLDELSSEFVKLEESIRRQTAVLEEAQTKLEAYKASLGAGEEVNDAQYIALADSVNAARSSLSALKTEQGQVAVAKVNATSESNSNDDSKKKAESSKATLTAITSLMATVGKATGGVTEQILSIGAQVLNLIPAFQAAGQAGAVMGSTLNTALGVVGIIFTVIMAVVNAIAQAEAEAKKKLEDNRKEIDSLRENSMGAGSLVSEYDMLSQKVIKTAEDMQRMNDIRAELVETYGFSVGAIDEEGRLLAGNLDMMKAELELSQELLKTKILESKEAEKKSFNNAMSDQVNLKKKIEVNETVDSLQTNMDPFTSFSVDMSQSLVYGNLDDMKQKLQEDQLEAKEALSNLFQIMILTAQEGGTKLSDTVQTAISEKLNNALNEALANGTEFNEEDVQAIFDSITNAYSSISDNVNIDSSIESINALKEQLITAFSMEEGIDAAGAGNAVTNILNSILGSPDEQEMIDRVEQLKQRIVEGLASGEEMTEYDSLVSSLGENFSDAQKTINTSIANGIPVSEEAKAAVDKMAKSYSINAKELIKMTAQEKASKMTLKDASSELRSVASSYDNVSKSIKNVANLKGAVQAIKNYNSATEKSEELSLQNADAKAYLAQYYGVEESAIDGMLPSLEDDIAMKETLALMDLEVAKASAEMAKVQIQAMIAAGTISEVEGNNMIAALDGVIRKMNELSATQLSIGGTAVKADSSGFAGINVPPRGGGGGAKKNKALEREKELLEHNKAMGQVTTAEEIANLERILAKYAKTTDEKRELTEKLYELRKQLAEEELEYQKAMDQLTLREEIAAMDKMIASYKEGTTARRDLEKERYEAARELERQEYDLKVYYGQMTLAEQEAQLKKMIASYKEGVQDRIDLEKELYDLQQTIRQQNIDRLNGLSDAIVSALQERYEAQREMEEKTLNDSIDAWQTWGDEQVAAIQRQIDALDELTKQESDAEEEAKKRRKIAMLEQQLLYEQDVYNRRKLQEEIVKSQKELDDWLVQKERDALKADLQKQIDAVNETVKTEQEKLQDKIDANNDYYEELEKEQNLRAEAQKMLMQSGQADIINLLKEFAPEYNATGQTLGDQLVDGFMSRVGDIEAWFASLTSSLTTYQQELALVATTAAEQYYSVHGYPTAQESPAPTGPVTNVGPTLNLYFTETTQSPAEIRCELERLLEQISQM